MRVRPAIEAAPPPSCAATPYGRLCRALLQSAWALDPGLAAAAAAQEVVCVPVSISYDLLMEERSLAKQLAGG